MIVGAGTALANGNQGATLEEVDVIIVEITSCYASKECTKHLQKGRGVFVRVLQDRE